MVHILNVKEGHHFFEKLLNNSIFPINAYQYPYVSFSTAGIFTADCNLPLIGGFSNSRLQTSTYERCLSNILSKIGYRLEAYSASPCKNNYLYQFLANRGYTLHSTLNSFGGVERDSISFAEAAKLFSIMAPGVRKQPILLFLETIYSHTHDYVTDPYCKIRVNEKCPTIFHGWDCTDQVIEEFFRQFDKYNLSENTDIILYSDHLHYSNNIYGDPRKIGILIPSIGNMTRRKLLTRTSNLYDIAPTVLEMLNISIEPNFLYGATLLNETKEPIYPSFYDYIILNNVYYQTFSLSKSVADKTGAYSLQRVNSSQKSDFLNS